MELLCVMKDLLKLILNNLLSQYGGVAMVVRILAIAVM